MNRFKVNYRLELYLGSLRNLMNRLKLDDQILSVQPFPELEIVLHGDRATGIKTWITKIVWVQGLQHYDIELRAMTNSEDEIKKIRSLLRENNWTDYTH